MSCICDCSSNGLLSYPTDRCMACGGDISSNINLETIERRIQNQTGVPQSQYSDVLASVTVAENYLQNPASLSNHSTVWGTKFNLRNRSDQRLPLGSSTTNVPTRGNSLKTTTTANRPGASAPPGLGVDVKHDSYARYLGKLKGRTMAIGKTAFPIHPNPHAVVNNKSWRFTLVNTTDCNCNGIPIPKIN
jgi:hypothetical protein